MKTWRLKEPEYDNDAQAELGNIINNGGSYSRYNVPGIDCSICTAWGSSVLSDEEVPVEILQKLRLNDSTPPLNPSDFSKLQLQIIQRMNSVGFHFTTEKLVPGLVFSPLILDIPEPPDFDILWRGTYLLISGKARSILSQFNDGSSFFCRAQYGIVGKWFPKELSQDKVEEIIDVEDALSHVSEFYPADTPLNYYGLGIRSRIYPESFVPNTVCKECGRFFWQHETQLVNPHIFYIGDTLHIGVSDNLKNALEFGGITNASFSLLSE